ncbi:MAG TPA: DUF58 domain-containing protein [Alcanivoracaceae bacterium]|nr:DUF58 domain-containing protein [Alcanivoracaceae bacterium]
MKALVQQTYAKWVAWRLPTARLQHLQQRLIFIVPSAYGFLFLAVAAAIFLAGINYQNNLLLGLSFYLASQFLVVMFATYRNLTGLTVEAERMLPNFMSQHGQLRFRLQARPKSRQVALWVSWRRGSQREAVSLRPNEEKYVALPLFLSQRGWNKPPRLCIETRYPLGLFRAWSHLDMAHSCLAWPTPIDTTEAPFKGATGNTEQTQQWQLGDEDFQGLREYVDSDSPTLVDWKSYARGRGLYVKEFSSPVASTEWLDWYSFTTGNTELKLSKLCYWVLLREKQQQPYGLRLPGFSLPPGLGEEHKQQALNALALFERGGQHEQSV